MEHIQPAESLTVEVQGMEDELERLISAGRFEEACVVCAPVCSPCLSLLFVHST